MAKKVHEAESKSCFSQLMLQSNQLPPVSSLRLAPTACQLEMAA